MTRRRGLLDTMSWVHGGLLDLPDYGYGPMTPRTQAGRANLFAAELAEPQRPNDYMAPVAEAISPTMGAYGAGQMVAEGSRAIGQGDYLSGGTGLALGMAGMIPGAPKKGIRAFHGSPHDFDRFDMSKIGTGTGAQEYGHGLYFAEQEGAARSYQSKLSRRHGHGTSGRMYEVRINADPEEFLDWDKPLSQQSEAVRSAAYATLEKNAFGREHLKPEANGGSVIQYAGYGDGGREQVMRDLREAGIPGVKYLDQGLRSAGDGSRNYVVFDDALVEILKKYGLLGMLGGGGVGSLVQQDQSQ